ncbi:MAG: MBL fold metallo-hydrolase [Armatimonadetes bacterium]|nr:MBL fold metallo-hydrolase [Armatimonadota bacterium]
MRITFLGTGTSHGVPMIGCDCPVCRSDDPKNTRTRSSVYIETGESRILIDTTPEMRIQMLREDISRVDAILFTHSHADHIFGLDDVRRFNDFNRCALPCYGNDVTLRDIRRSFEYVFVPTQIGGGKPSLDLIAVNGPFTAAGISVIPIKVKHGKLDVLGYRIGDFAYVTDVSFIPETSLDLLENLNTLVLGVIRPKPHETHLSLGEGVELVEMLQPKRAYFTHIAHQLDHQSTNAILPQHIRLAYDGLQIDV